MFITSEEMEILDINCEYYGISRLQLMENAGKSVADEIHVRFKNAKNICIYAGLGNNGGDGFVAARFLTNFGYNVEVFLLGRSSLIKTDEAKRNFEILDKCGCKIHEIRDSTDLEKVNCDLIVDSILGTGIKGKLREPISKAVDVINECKHEFKSIVVAVDVPTGLDPDTGKFEKAVRADLTVTFHKPKLGLKSEIAGEVVVKDIGIPKSIEMLTGPGDVKKAYRRFSTGHKGVHGRIVVIGGGPYSGAPALASLAAYYAGADLVITVVPENIGNIVASFSPNLIVKTIPGKMITEGGIETVYEVIKRADVVVMGMGTETSDEVLNAAEKILRICRKAVIDAGMIVKEAPEGIDCILTPHKGEFKRVFKREPTLDRVKKVARKVNATILLKGYEDIITDGNKLKINKTGNAGMTVGGTGDILAGLCGAFLCNSDAFRSACSAAFINGLAGDYCYKEKGYNYTATDMLEFISDSINFSLSF